MGVESITESMNLMSLPSSQERDVSMRGTDFGTENEDSLISAKRREKTDEELPLAKELDERSIYVANVDYAANPQHLEAIFLQVGVVQKVTILIHRYTGFPKGYAYVAFAEKESVQRAIEELDGTVLRGRPLKIHQKKTIIHERPLHGSSSGRGRGKRRGRGSGRGVGRGSSQGPEQLKKAES